MAQSNRKGAQRKKGSEALDFNDPRDAKGRDEWIEVATSRPTRVSLDSQRLASSHSCGVASRVLRSESLMLRLKLHC